MDYQLRTVTDENFAVGPQHIGAILPQVLARYGIAIPPERATISSARLRRRMVGTVRGKSKSWQRGHQTGVVAAAG
jgi:hypothetical protein